MDSSSRADSEVGGDIKVYFGLVCILDYARSLLAHPANKHLFFADLTGSKTAKTPISNAQN